LRCGREGNGDLLIVSAWRAEHEVGAEKIPVEPERKKEGKWWRI